MYSQVAITWGLLAWQSAGLAAEVETTKPASASLASGLVLNWGLGLVLVLAVFLICVGMLKKANSFGVNNPGRMRIVGGIALGMREKVVLLQVGKKQVLLGVTPGRIQTLHVLEGEDCLPNEAQGSLLDNGFAQKLMHAMKVRNDA